MKSEERHELEQNDLQVWLYAMGRKYGSYIVLVAALIVLTFEAYNYYQNQQESKRRRAWEEFSDAAGLMGLTDPDPGRLKVIATQYDIRELQAMSYKAIGDYYLTMLTMGLAGTPAAKVTPSEAESQAQDAYTKVINEYTDQRIAAGQARLGLGRLFETKHQTDKARDQYKALTDKGGAFADSEFAAEAQRRLDHLDEWSEPVAFGADLAIHGTGAALGSGFGSGLSGALAPTPATPATVPATMPGGVMPLMPAATTRP